MKQLIKDNQAILFILSPLIPLFIVGFFASILGLELTEENKTQAEVFGQIIYGKDLFPVTIFSWLILFTLPIGIIWQLVLNSNKKKEKS